MRSRWFNIFVLLSLLLGTLPLSVSAAPAAEPAAAPAPQGTGNFEVEAALRAQLAADETAGYLIYFREKPDLSPAYGMGWIERGRFVANALNQAALNSQANVRAYLDRQGVKYQAFWIQNVISVESSNHATFDGLKAYPEIETIRQHRQLGLIEPEQVTAPSAPQAVEPNILHVLADQVWAMGYTGEGIVVANVDTGVRYSHNALVNHYRGNLGGTFDHNYNWWDPYGDHPTEPGDDNGHGSHTMGTMVGDDGGANQIGMAPGAKWIACRACNTNNCTDTSLLECAQFIAAPWDLTKSNANPDKRPNAVNNSWGDCGTSYDPWYRDVVDAWQAAGIYPVFSNGNASNCGYPAPPGLNTVGNPARYGNVTGVGSSGRDNGQYATHSNWGPTDNLDEVNPKAGHADLKPQVLAPGVNIRSSTNGSDTEYQGGWSGTSMSAPHVTGLIALMWQAAPCLIGEYARTETIIEDTATPIPYDDTTGGGAHVPNYASGWGEINALAAVQAAAGECGDSAITGQVTAAGNPVAGALVKAISDLVERKATTNAQGFYAMTVFSDTYTLQAARYGYQTAVVPNVAATTGATTTQNITLIPAQMYEVSGQVTDAATGWPLYAHISISGDPVDPLAPDNAVWTNPATGMYSLMLAEDITYTFEVSAWVAGYGEATGEVAPLTQDVTANFALQADMAVCTAPGYYFTGGLMANFEDKTFPPAGWTVVDNGGNCTWEVGSDSNNTGGDGKYANADSDACGSGTTMNTDLVSPPFDVSGLSQVNLSFAYDYNNLDVSEQAAVDVSADGGATWANIVTWTTDKRGPATFSQDVTAILGGSTQARVRFHYYAPGWDWWWQVDDVVLGNPVCQLPPDGGLVVGNVYDENYPTVALNGATVVNAAGGETAAVATPDDAAVNDAFYTLFAPEGAQVFTATMAGGYGLDVATVTVVDGGAVEQNFLVPAGLLDATPDSVAVTVELGYATSANLNLGNTGGAAAAFELKEREGEVTPIHIQRYTGSVPQVAALASAGLAPKDGVAVVAPEMPVAFPLSEAAPAFAVNANTGELVTFMSDTPDTWTIIGNTGLGGPFAGDFLSGDFSLMYVLDYDANALYGVDTATGNATLIGPSVPDGFWTGMTASVDGVLYAASTTGSQSYLYTIDTATGTPTLVGEITNAPVIIDIAINADGEMYGVEIMNDVLVAIDPETGAGTGVGSIGINASYAQGMDFEEDSGVLYLAAFNVGTYQGELRIADTETGNSVLIGTFPGGAEVDCLSFATGGASDVPWLTESPVMGSVPAAGNAAVALDFDAVYVDQPGEYHAKLTVKNDTPYGKFDVPVTMTVTPPQSWGKVMGTVTGLGVCDAELAPLEEAEVRIESATTGDVWTLTTDVDGTYVLWLDQAHSPLTITVTAPDYFGETGGVVVAQGETTVVDFELRLLLPCLSYAPADFDVTLAMGENTVEPLTLSNTGAGMAEYEMVEKPGGFMPVVQMRPSAQVIPQRARLAGYNPDAMTTEGILAAGGTAPVGILAAGDVLAQWNTGLALPWGTGYSLGEDTVWLSNPAAGGGDDDNHEFTTDGTPTGRTVGGNFGGVWAADIAYNPNTGMFWQVDVGGDNCIYEWDPASGATGNVICGAAWTATSQRGLAYDPTDDTFFIGGWNDANVYHFDNTGAVLEQWALGLSISGMAYNFEAGYLFIIENSGTDTITVFDVASGSVVDTFTVAGFGNYSGAGLAIDCDGNLWAANQNNGDAYLVDSGVPFNLCASISGGIPWLTETPISGTIAADTDVVVDLAFDAGVPETMQPGTYYGELKVDSNAANDVSNVPVTLTVTPPDTWGKVAGVVTGLGYCDAATPILLEEAEVTIESSTGLIEWVVLTDENGAYQLWLDEAHSPVTITVVHPDHTAQVFTNVEVTAGETTLVDAALRWAQPCLTVDPDLFDVAVTLGTSTTLPFSLTNHGAEAATFDLTESNGGFTMLRSVRAGTFEFLNLSEAVKTGMMYNGSALRTSARPAEYRAYVYHSPQQTAADPNILVYADDDQHYPSGVELALQELGLSYTFYGDGELDSFVSDLSTGGPWDIAILAADSWAYYTTPEFDALYDFVTAGGKVIVHSWVIGYDSLHYDHPLWAAMGADFASWVTTPGPMYWWEAGHQLFNYPESVPEFEDITNLGYTAYGAKMDPLATGTAIAGFATTPAAGQGGMIVRDDSATIYKGQTDNCMDGDADTDGVWDVAEWWTNAVNYIVYGAAAGEIPWLSEDPTEGVVAADSTFAVDVTFDASAAVTQITQPGKYFGTLFANSDDPFNDSIPVSVTMTVLPPATWGKLMGTVTGLGYCDADPAPLAGASVFIEGSSGVTWTLTTDVSGTYQLWLDEMYSPVTITVSYPDYEKGEDIVVVTGGMTSTEDFDLRLLAPCVAAEPMALHATLEIFTTATAALTLTNSGAVDTDWSLTEENLGDPTVTLPGELLLFSETFEGAFPPAGWSRVENISSCDWESSVTTGYTNNTGGTGEFADANSDWCGDEMDAELWTPAFDLSAAAAPVLRFQSDFNDFGGADDGYVDVSTDGGGTWTTLLHYDGVDVRGPQVVDVDLSAYAGQSNVIVRFYYVAGGWDWYWQVDDVQLLDADPVIWLAENPFFGNLVADTGVQVVDVDFDANAVAQPGDYVANLWVNSDDPTAPIILPVTMTVTAPGSWGQMVGIVSSLGRCDVTTATLAGAEVVIWDDGGTAVVTLTTGADGVYSYWLPTGDYTVTVAEADHVGDVAVVTVPASGVVAQDFNLFWLGPCATIEPNSIVDTLPMGASSTHTVTLTNMGAGVLDYAFFEYPEGYLTLPTAVVSVPPAAPQRLATIGNNGLSTNPKAVGKGVSQPAPLLPMPTGVYVLTHSLSQVVQSGNSVSCNASGLHTDNSYLRVFDLGDFGIAGSFNVTSVAVGVETAVAGGATQPATVNLYTLAGPLSWANMTLIGSANVAIADQSLTILDVPVSAMVPAGSVLVVEFFTPNGQGDGNSFFVGSNNLGQTAPTYLAAAACGISEPTDVGAIGFPGMHLVMNVTGTTRTPVDVPWLSESPISGTVAAATAEAVIVTLDADQVPQPGVYSATLEVVNNDAPMNQFPISVVLTATLPATYGQITGTVTGLGPCDDLATAVPLEGADVIVESASRVWTLATDADGDYALWFDEMYAPVTITVMADGYVADSVTGVEVVSGTTTVQDFSLSPEVPCLSVAPDAYHLTLTMGMSETVPLTVTNAGAADAGVALEETDGGMSVMRPALNGVREILLPSAAAPADARTAPAQVGFSAPVYVPQMPAEVLINEGFEAGVPPADWDAIVNNANTWSSSTGNPHGGAANAHVLYDYNQNEWLLSPEMPLAEGTLSFWSLGSLYWCRDTYDNCDLNVWIVVGSEVDDGDDILVGTADGDWPANWTWAQTTFDLTPLLPGGPVRIGFQYEGDDGAEVGLDDVMLDGITALPIPWLTESPVTATVAAHGAQAFDLTFDAGVPEITQPGDYYGVLDVAAADVKIPVPVTLTVEPPATWGKLTGMVNSLGYCNAMTMPLEGAVVFVESAITQTVLVEASLVEDDFEGTFPPSGWSLVQTGASDDPGWQQTSSRFNSGSFAAYHDDNNTTGDAISWLILPQVTIPTGGGALRFWQSQNYDTWYIYHGLWVSTASDDPADFVELTEFGAGAEDAWEQIAVDLSAYAGQSIYLAFRYEGDYADEWYVDDVAVTGMTEVVAPVNWTLTTDAAGAYGVWLDEMYSPVTVTVSNEAGYEAQVFVGVDVTGGEITTLNTNLVWLRPCVTVAPDALSRAVPLGNSVTAHLTLDNLGAVNGTFLVNEINAGVDPLAPLAAGGPDAFGYEYADSNNFFGPVYGFVDIADVGTPIALGDNDFEEVALGFGFKFYGDSAADPNIYNSVFVNSNGFLSFGAGSTDISPDPALPDPTLPNNLIAAAWDDLKPGVGGLVYVESFAQCPYNPNPMTVDACFIVQYTNFVHADGSPAGTFEVILFHTGSILMQYAVVDAPDATTGIEDSLGLVGLNYAPTLADELAICFAYPGEWTDCQSSQVPWLTVEPTEGEVLGGESVTLDVTFNAGVPEVAVPGVYMAWLGVYTNDPFVPYRYIPVTMTVGQPDTLVKLQGIVTTWSQCDAVSDTIAGVQVAVATSSGDSFVLTTHDDGSYATWLPLGDTFTMTVSHYGYVPMTAVGTVQTAMLPHNMDMRMDVPCISLTPASFDVTLPKERTVTRTLTIHNAGAGDFPYNDIFGHSEWLSVSPAWGVVPANGEAVVTLTFDAVGAVAGDVYSTVLEIAHMNPMVSRLLIRPVRMTVLAEPVVMVDVVKTANPANRVMPGGLITYTVVFTNSYDRPLDLQATDMVPAGTTYVALSITGGAVYEEPSGDRITWAGTLASGATATFSYVVEVGASVPRGTVITNTVTIEAAGLTFADDVAVTVGPRTVYLPLVMRAAP